MPTVFLQDSQKDRTPNNHQLAVYIYSFKSANSFNQEERQPSLICMPKLKFIARNPSIHYHLFLGPPYPNLKVEPGST